MWFNNASIIKITYRCFKSTSYSYFMLHFIITKIQYRYFYFNKKNILPTICLTHGTHIQHTYCWWMFKESSFIKCKKFTSTYSYFIQSIELYRRALIIEAYTLSWRTTSVSLQIKNSIPEFFFRTMFEGRNTYFISTSLSKGDGGR